MTRSTAYHIACILTGAALLVAHFATCHSLEVYRHSLEAAAIANGAEWAVVMQGAALGRLFGCSPASGSLLYLAFMCAMLLPLALLVYGFGSLRDDSATRRDMI